MDNNLSLYYVFYTVAECKNISSAAKKLYISQPAVSKSILKLEQNLKTTLFIRTSKGVSLTYEGKLLYQKVMNAFDSIKSGEDTIKHILEFGEGHISFGTSTTLCRYELIPYLKDFIKENPNVSISIECNSTYETLELLNAGKIDLGLIGIPEDSNDIISNHTYIKIGEIEDVFVATKDYLALMPSKDIIRHSTLLMLDKENLSRKYVDKYLAAEGIEPYKLIEATSMDLLIDFAKIGLGIACVIKQFVENEIKSGELVPIKLPSPLKKRSIGFIYDSEKISSKAVQKFIDHLTISPK